MEKYTLLKLLNSLLSELKHNEIIKAWLLEFSDFKKKCLEKELIKSENSDAETCIEKIIIEHLKNKKDFCQNYAIIPKPSSSCIFRKNKRKLDIGITYKEENNNEIILTIEVKLNCKSKFYGWDEAFIQSLIYQYEYRYKNINILIIMFDNFLKRRLCEKEIKFLNYLRKSGIYYFRFYCDSQGIKSETNLPNL